MKVGKLIERLESFNKTAEVYVGAVDMEFGHKCEKVATVEEDFLVLGELDSWAEVYSRRLRSKEEESKSKKVVLIN